MAWAKLIPVNCEQGSFILTTRPAVSSTVTSAGIESSVAATKQRSMASARSVRCRCRCACSCMRMRLYNSSRVTTCRPRVSSNVRCSGLNRSGVRASIANVPTICMSPESSGTPA